MFKLVPALWHTCENCAIYYSANIAVNWGNSWDPTQMLSWRASMFHGQLWILCDPTEENPVVWGLENGTISTHNVVYWSDKNHHIALNAKHQTKLWISVWCGIHGSATVRPVFMNNRLTISSWNIIALMSHLQFYFQQDGATPLFRGSVHQWLDQFLYG